MSRRDAGVDHIMVQPEDRDVDDWMRAVEKIARVASALGRVPIEPWA